MSDTDTTIRPALTTEQWAAWRAFYDSDHAPYEMTNYLGALSEHAVAAVMLEGQPFGFTHEDVALLAFLGKQPEGFDIEWGEAMRARARSLADRLGALLPPETP